MILYLIIGFVIGLVFALGVSYIYLWEKYMDHGGDILLDEESGVYRLIINEDIEEWGSERYLIFKVSTTEQKLKRLNDIDPMSLEDGNGDINEGGSLGR